MKIPKEINRIKYIVCCPLCDNKKCVRGTNKCEAEIWAKKKSQENEETETWKGIHAQLTVPKGTFEQIFNDADDENDI